MKVVRTEITSSRREQRRSLSLIGKTRSNDAWHRMREDILCGVLAPGSRLRFEQLKSMYGVAYATLREALSRLATEQLVHADAQRGFTVAPIAVDELLDITRVRIMLETEALRDSIAKGDEQWRTNVVCGYHTLDRLSLVGSGNSSDWFQAHRQFHANLLAACGSPVLIILCGRLFDSCHRYRRISLHRLSPNAPSDQHRELMEAALTGRADDAVATMREHIWKTTNNVVTAIEGLNGTQSNDAGSRIPRANSR